MQVVNNVFIQGQTPAAVTSAMRLIIFMSFLVCMAAMHSVVIVVQSVATTGGAASNRRATRQRSIWSCGCGVFVIAFCVL